MKREYSPVVKNLLSYSTEETDCTLFAFCIIIGGVPAQASLEKSHALSVDFDPKRDRFMVKNPLF
jgi:hypothetical protein